MCLAVIALDRHPRYRLIVAANRDEFHGRPAARAQWWRDDTGAELLGGRDLEQGGTWLGVNRAGRWAFVTNVREPFRHNPHAPSRGSIVPYVLRDDRDVHQSIADVVRAGVHQNGFNVVAGEETIAAFGSNRQREVADLRAGVYGVSNASIDTAWPKLARAKAGVVAWLERTSNDLDALFDVLADRTLAPDTSLPDTGISRERERLLSSPFIVSSDYGTRCSTILAIDRAGEVDLRERTFNAKGEIDGDVAHHFRLARIASERIRSSA
jgi:uncharacterized protein with NRDE domain